MSIHGADQPSRRLGVIDATAIIVGTVIGAGIYETSPLIAANTTSLVSLVAVFVIGAVCAIVGALCYSELGNSVNKTGGDFEYLQAAYGAEIAFLYAWMAFWIIQPASVGAIAYIFARYAANFSSGIDESHYAVIAASAVAGLTIANVVGMHVGTLAQRALTAIKVAGIVILVALGFYVAPAPGITRSEALVPQAHWGLAFILVMYTYGG